MRKTTAVLALALASCGQGSGGDSGRSLFEESELLALEDRHARELEVFRDKICERPPLRGEAVEGSADEELAALVEGEGVGRCLELTSELAGDDLRLLPALDEEVEEERQPPEQIAQIEEGCDRLLERLDEALRHRSGCSPYLPGRRPEPEELINAMRVNKVLVVLANEARREGQVERSAAALLDGLRFGQDLTRGGPNLLLATVGVSSSAVVYQPLADLLDRSGYLPEPLLVQMENELSILLASEPHPREFFAGERASILSRAREEATEEPEEGEERRPARFATKTLGLDEREDRALADVAFERMTSRLEDQCPAAVTPRQCRINVDLDTALLDQRSQQLDIAEDIRTLFGHERPRRYRERIIEILMGVATPDYGRYLDQYASRSFMYAALRLQVALRREVEAGGACVVPDPTGNDRWGGLRRTAAPEAGRWDELMRDPYTGARLEVSAVSQGLLKVRSPAVPELEERGIIGFEHTIDCGEMVRQIERSREEAQAEPTEEEAAAAAAAAAEVEAEPPTTETEPAEEDETAEPTELPPSPDQPAEEGPVSP